MSDVVDTDLGWQAIANLQDIAVEVGTDVPYAKYLEFGTERMSPHPFLGPTIDAQGGYADELEDAARDILSGRRPATVMSELGARVVRDVMDEIQARHLIKTGRLFNSQSFDVVLVEGAE